MIEEVGWHRLVVHHRCSYGYPTTESLADFVEAGSGGNNWARDRHSGHSHLFSRRASLQAPTIHTSGEDRRG